PSQSATAPERHFATLPDCHIAKCQGLAGACQFGRSVVRPDVSSPGESLWILNIESTRLGRQDQFILSFRWKKKKPRTRVKRGGERREVSADRKTDQTVERCGEAQANLA